MRKNTLSRFASPSTFFLAVLLSVSGIGCDRAPEGMVKVPSGPFIMGSDETDPQDKAAEYGILKPWFKDEHPAHRLTLPTYYIDTLEVSNQAYRAFVQDTGRRPPPDWAEGRYDVDRVGHPVVHVTWEDANAYCLWAGKRLPTEAEWEKAARGTDGRSYPWGNFFDPTRANVNNLVGNTSEGGRYDGGKSPYGAYDMIGNVWEWTADWYRAYPGNTYENELFGEKARVLRGNSWAGMGHFSPEVFKEIMAHNSRAAFRLFLAPDGRVNDVGFRCAKSG